MYVGKHDAEELIRDQMKSIIESLGKKQSYLNALWDDDDWAFVIKIHSLIEDCLAKSIVRYIGQPEISKSIIAMPLDGGSASKIEIAKEFGLINSQQKGFIKMLSKLRNDLAHQPDSINFIFETYIQSLTKEQLKNWKQTLSWFEKSPKESNWPEHSVNNPKMTIHVAAFILVALLEVDVKEKEIDRHLQLLSETTMKDFFS